MTEQKNTDCLCDSFPSPKQQLGVKMIFFYQLHTSLKLFKLAAALAGIV